LKEKMLFSRSKDKKKGNIMTADITGVTILTGISGFTLVMAVYEFTTGRIPGDPVQRGLWGYKWIKTPRRQRVVVLVGGLVVISFLIVERPFSLGDLIAGGIGVLLAALVVASDARSRS
jgi:PII-like signaling protein